MLMCLRVGKRALCLVSYEKDLVYEKYWFTEHFREEKILFIPISCSWEKKSLSLPKT